MTTTESSSCPFCASDVTIKQHRSSDQSGWVLFECRTCGHFALTDDDANQLADSETSVSSWYNVPVEIIRGKLRNHWERTRKPFRLTSESLTMLQSQTQVPRDVVDQLDLVLKWIGAKQATITGRYEKLKAAYDYPIAFASSHEEMDLLVDALEEQRMVTVREEQLSKASGVMNSSREPTVRLTPAGWHRLRALKESAPSNDQAFVAMWFDPTMNEPYARGIAAGISNAGYVPRRIDSKQTNNKICDEILAEIRRSRFIVADVSGQRNGVYFEAGFALGRGLPVIWTAKKGTRLHFDTRQYAHILWDDHADLARSLELRIRATIGDGPKITKE